MRLRRFTLKCILLEVMQDFVDRQVSGQNLVADLEVEDLKVFCNIKPGPAKILLRYIAKLKAAAAPHLPALPLLALPLLSFGV